MGAKKDLFLAIQARIKTVVPQIKTVALQGGQLISRKTKRQPIFFPCVLVKFSDIPYTDLAEGIQEGEVTLNIQVASEMIGLDVDSYSANQAEALAFFDLQEEVHIALQGFAPTNCSPFLRSVDRQDDNFEKLYIFETSYKTLMKDASTAFSNQQEYVTVTSLEVEKDLEITNNIIRL